MEQAEPLERRRKQGRAATAALALGALGFGVIMQAQAAPGVLLALTALCAGPGVYLAILSMRRRGWTIFATWGLGLCVIAIAACLWRVGRAIM